MSDVELKPCPFCGGSASVSTSAYADGSRLKYIECHSCGATVGDEDEGQMAAARWNTRPEEDRLRVEVEALRARVAELEWVGAHEWTKHEREGWTVCSRCGMVRNYDRETPCRGTTPPVAPRDRLRSALQVAEQKNTELVAETWELGSEIEERAIEQARLREALQVAERERDLRSAQIGMIASELAGDSKLHWLNDRSDPRWTPTIQEAWSLRQKVREDAKQIVGLMHERDAALARAEKAEQQVAQLELEVKDLRATTTGPAWDKYHDAIARAEKAEADVSELRATVKSFEEDVRDGDELYGRVVAFCRARGIPHDDPVRADFDKVETEFARLVEVTNAFEARAEVAEAWAEGWENTHNQVKAQWKEAVERAEKAERERDEARAELAKMQDAFTGSSADAVQYLEERDAARAEAAELRAEVERLRGVIITADGALCSYINESSETLRAEFLEALEDTLGPAADGAREALGK